MNNSPLSNDLNIQNLAAQATSTPQINAKNTDSNKMSTAASIVNEESKETNQNLLSQAPIRASLDEAPKSDGVLDDDEQPFFDHDDFQLNVVDSKPALVEAGSEPEQTPASFTYAEPYVHFEEELAQLKSKNIRSNFTLIVLVLIVFLFFYSLIQYWKCSLAGETDLVFRSDHCNLPQLTELKDYFKFPFKYIKSALFYSMNNEWHWVPWSVACISNDSNLLFLLVL